MVPASLLRFATLLAFASAAAFVAAQPAPDAIRKGAAVFSQNCAACHGARMADPQGAFDLRQFPADEKNRFVTSVTKGKNSMPPWGDLLNSDELEALWAYVVAGEK